VRPRCTAAVAGALQGARRVRGLSAARAALRTRLAAVVQHKHLAVLKGRHGAGVHVDIRVCGAPGAHGGFANMSTRKSVRRPPRGARTDFDA